MNIPLDNLYHWIRGLAREPVSIYTFRPHGSKNITDLTPLSIEDSLSIAPEIVCHDQEPLNYAAHQDVNMLDFWMHVRRDHPEWSDHDATFAALAPQYRHLNFYTMLRATNVRVIFDRYILLHSEKNSNDVEKFSESAEMVYYWCHGVIARDWYRFAQHDPRLSAYTKKHQTFLVYARAWTGTREYRLKFLDLLIQHQLSSSCRTSILQTDQNILLENYKCINPRLQPDNVQSILNFSKNNCLPSSSADYDPADIVETDISIVLETVADDTKIHLTEKTLRPIACGHPFMIVAGPRSLEYLRSYGFKTFSPFIDESYDQESDLVKRMQLVINEMTRINNLPIDQKQQLIQELQQISAFNKQHFFSQDFFDILKSELIENLNYAIENVKHTRGSRYLEIKKAFKKYLPTSDSYEFDNKKRKIEVAKILKMLRKNPKTNLAQIIKQWPPGVFNY